MKKYGVLLLFLLIVSCSKDSDSLELNQGYLSHELPTGASARDFLSEGQFTSLVVEILYMEGALPSQQALDSFKQFIMARCHKSAGVQLLVRSIGTGVAESYTMEQVVALEKEHRSVFANQKQLSLSVLYVDGAYQSQDNTTSEDATKVVLGVAYRNTSFVVFKKDIDRIGQGDSSLEATVLKHEFSHLLGLVDLGSPMQEDHLDTAHGHHCVEENCLMHYQVESGGLFNSFLSPVEAVLDSKCLADLRANGGK